MNLFRVMAETEQDEPADPRMWLVAADSLFQAISLVPDHYIVKSVDVQLDAALGPERVIEQIAAPTFH